MEGSRTAFFPLVPDRETREQGRGAAVCVWQTLDDVERLKAMYDASTRGKPGLARSGAEALALRDPGLWDDPRVRDADLRTHGADSRYWMIETPDREVAGSVHIAQPPARTRAARGRVGLR